MHLRIISLVVAALALVMISPPAAAQNGTSTPEEIRSLADRAADDDAALERLRQIDSIDGEDVDLRRALQGARGDEVVERIDTLLDGIDAPSQSVGSATARRQAEEILGQQRFRSARVPRPFRGVLEAISDAFAPVGRALTRLFRAIADVFDALARATPGGANTLWFVLGAALIALAIWYSRRVISRRIGIVHEKALAERVGDAADPRVLEREAREAEGRGDHDTAVRLRFRAGLLRLHAARVIPARDSLTTGEVRRLLRSPYFDRLGTTFDAVAYGGRRADAKDATEARAEWERVLREKVRA